LAAIAMKDLLEAGVHFGHQTKRWNPKMKEYIFGERNGIYIIDLGKTVKLFRDAEEFVSRLAAEGRTILFVGTKRQAQDGVAEAAKRSAQYFVNSRWLGGTLTNWKTISGSIKRLRHLDEVLNSGDANAYTKKERLTLQRERDKLDRSLGGIKDMGGLPDLIFVIDTNKEDIAIQEAQRLNIPVAAIVDTNSDPKGITYVVPGNDDAGRAITLYCDLIARAVIDGISRAQGDSGIDIGASAQPIREEIPVAPQPAGFQGLAGPRGTADDLKKLTGVSGAIEKKFNDLGIFHYWQLAELDHDTAHKIGEEVGLPSRADGWVAQAKAMTAEAE
jgi:small subunit ribosomal protein S2